LGASATGGWKVARPKQNYQIEMSSRETLVTVVEAVLREGFQRIDGDAADTTDNNSKKAAAPGWAVTFAKQAYMYQGWLPECEANFGARLRNELLNEGTGEAPSIESMVWKFKSGLNGVVISEAGTFEFWLQRLSAVKDKSPVFEIKPVQPSFSGKLARDFLDTATLLKANQFRHSNDTYYNRKSIWHRKENRVNPDDEYEACFATRPAWAPQDTKLLALLFAGTGPKKFHKTWLEISRYGLLPHKYSDAADHWKGIECGQHDNLLESIRANYHTKKEMIMAAKQLALQLLEEYMEQGVPESQPKPEGNKRQRLE